MKKLLLLSVLTLSSLSANAGVLWQKAESGMSVSGIKKLYPNVVPVSEEPDKHSNYKTLLEIPSYKIGNYDYKVGFTFKGDELRSVNLSLKAKDPEPAFNEVKRLLHSKYGQPYNVEKNNVSTKISWKDKQTDVSLYSIMSFIQITYKDLADSEANKL